MNCCATSKLNIFWVIIEFFKSCRYISLSRRDPQTPTSTVMNLTFHPEQYDYFYCNEFCNEESEKYKITMIEYRSNAESSASLN